MGNQTDCSLKGVSNVYGHWTIAASIRSFNHHHGYKTGALLCVTSRWGCNVFEPFRYFPFSQSDPNQSTLPDIPHPPKESNEAKLLCVCVCVFHEHSLAHSYNLWHHFLSAETHLSLPPCSSLYFWNKENKLGQWVWSGKVQGHYSTIMHPASDFVCLWEVGRCLPWGISWGCSLASMCAPKDRANRKKKIHQEIPLEVCVYSEVAGG